MCLAYSTSSHLLQWRDNLNSRHQARLSFQEILANDHNGHTARSDVLLPPA